MPQNNATALDRAVDLDEPRSLAQTDKSSKKREAIIRAATEVINAKSYALATMTDIAAVLELRDATLYYYFPSKQMLAFECHRHSLGRFERLLLAADRGGGRGAEKLERFLRSMLDDAYAYGPQLYLGDYSYLDEDQRRVVASSAAELTQVLERFLQDGIADGSIIACETQLVVQLLLGMLIWLAKWVPSIDHLTVDRLMAAIGVFSLEGLRN